MNTEQENGTGFNGGGGGDDGFAFEQIDRAADRVALVEGGVVFTLECSDCEATRYALAGTPIDGLFFTPLEAMKLGEALIAAAAKSNGAAS